MLDLSLAELRQVELALVARKVQLTGTKPNRRGRLHDFMVERTSAALNKVIDEAVRQQALIDAYEATKDA